MTEQEIFKLAKEKGYSSSFDFISLSFYDDAIHSELYLIKKWLADKHNIHLNVIYTTNKHIGEGYIWGIIELPESDKEVGLYYDELDALIDGLYESLNSLNVINL